MWAMHINQRCLEKATGICAMAPSSNFLPSFLPYLRPYFLQPAPLLDPATVAATMPQARHKTQQFLLPALRRLLATPLSFSYGSTGTPPLSPSLVPSIPSSKNFGLAALGIMLCVFVALWSHLGVKANLWPTSLYFCQFLAQHKDGHLFATVSSRLSTQLFPILFIWFYKLSRIVH